MSNKLLVVIGGPTGVGKTNLAIQLALHYHSEIICADSRQIYSELNIGVGRPDEGQLNSIPHHLLGHTSIFEPYTAADFEKEALTLLDKLFEQHDVIFLTGGTGLYVKAVTEGLDAIPDVPQEINARWTQYWKENGTPALVEQLATKDPEYLEIVDKQNHMRLIRALAVCDHTGQPFSSFRTGESKKRDFKILQVVLDLPREELYNKINARVLHMMESGWLEEAMTLHPHKHLKALQTLGYQELFDFLEEKVSWSATIAAIQQSTRRYAKRQNTWWRHQGSWQSFRPDDWPSIISVIDLEMEKV